MGWSFGVGFDVLENNKDPWDLLHAQQVRFIPYKRRLFYSVSFVAPN